MRATLPLREKHTRGDTFSRMWVLRDNAGNPINITGAQVRAQLRTSTDVVVAEASTENGRISLQPLAGTIVMSIPYTAMTTVNPGQYWYDVEVTLPSGYRRTVYYATVDIQGDVTR